METPGQVRNHHPRPPHRVEIEETIKGGGVHRISINQVIDDQYETNHLLTPGVIDNLLESRLLVAETVNFLQFI